jgi:transcriptional regulator with XRE-family HTH domain
MTPFGEKLRALRAARGATLKQMAEAIGVSSAYLSSLEHGRRGRPSWYLIQRIITYFARIFRKAELIDPSVSESLCKIPDLCTRAA